MAIVIDAVDLGHIISTIKAKLGCFTYIYFKAHLPKTNIQEFINYLYSILELISKGGEFEFDSVFLDHPYAPRQYTVGKIVFLSILNHIFSDQTQSSLLDSRNFLIKMVDKPTFENYYYTAIKLLESKNSRVITFNANQFTILWKK